ncbi:MAG: argininosuccinate lyase [Candidatus Tectomicrobia bacterium]|nr:argininosuccinate lyase [Candidatus Tectomicrobia bacterium]
MAAERKVKGGGRGRAPAKPWGGRFSGRTDPRVEAFTQSVSFDRRLAPWDIRGSIAHAEMLGACRIIPRADARKIAGGLRAILREVEKGRFSFDPALEDVHMNIEAALTRRIGPAGGRLHTARSRNDQVATSVRLWLREEIDRIQAALKGLRKALLRQAERGVDWVMPGYTHLQRAQPVTFAHHLLAYGQMFRRDAERLAEARRRVNVLPLGAGALAGTAHPIDRRMVARRLGFAEVAGNSMDAVSDRDFAVEFAATAALAMVHLSRLGEEVVLWASAEFGFVELPDAFSTGSSLMPQKRNPDPAEIVRGKSARVIGDLVALLALLKGLPLTYNRDMQEDKEPLFDAADTLRASLEVMAGLVDAVRPRPERMAQAAEGGYMTATDLADAMVRRGVPFREAHEAAGRAVRLASSRGVPLSELRPADLKKADPRLRAADLGATALARSVASRRSEGGASRASVLRQIRAERKRLDV